MNPPPGIEALPNGQWVVAGDTHLGLWAKQKGTIVTDPNLFNFLYPHIKDCKVVWDVGANIGDHTRQYLNWGMKVVAFEPHPLTFQCLEHNCPEAENYEFAASDRDHLLPFAISDNVGASRIQSGGEGVARGRVLDDLILHPPDYIKLDVEGYEPFAITGMAGTITRHRPILYVEMNRGALEANGASPEALHDTILSLGYPKWKPYPIAANFNWPQWDVLYLP